MKERFGDRLQSLRTRKGLTSDEVATRIGAPKSTYRAWEGGRAIRGEEVYLKLSDVLEVSLYELLSGRKLQVDDARTILRRIEEELASLKRALNRLS